MSRHASTPSPRNIGLIHPLTTGHPRRARGRTPQCLNLRRDAYGADVEPRLFAGAYRLTSPRWSSFQIDASSRALSCTRFRYRGTMSEASSCDSVRCSGFRNPATAASPGPTKMGRARSQHHTGELGWHAIRSGSRRRRI